MYDEIINYIKYIELFDTVEEKLARKLKKGLQKEE